MSETIDAIAKKYGGTVSLDEIAAKYGGAPAGVPKAGAPLPIPQGLQPQADIPEPLKALTIGVDPSTFVERGMGALSSITNTLFPGGDVRKTTPQLPELTPQQDIGAKAVTVGGAAQALSSLAPPIRKFGEGLMSDARQYVAGGKVPYVEQGLAPSGIERKAITADIAPRLAEDPLVANVKKALMDKAVFNKFTAASADLEAAAKGVPRGTTVAKQPLLDQLKSAIDEQSTFSSTPELVANESGKRILGDWYNKLSKLPDRIPFDELRKFRQQLDSDIAVHGGWKDTATLADRTEMVANRHVVNTIRGQLKGVSEALDKADDAYSLAADAMNAAGLDWKTGRRLANVGKPASMQKAVSKAKDLAVKGAIGGGLLGAGYGVGKELVK